MKLRKLPGALALGLLASLVAHAATYGAGHAAGGAYQADVLSLALAGGVGFVLLLGLAAWFDASRMADGSVLASRLLPLLPNPAAIGAVATVSFAGIELLESHHAQAPGALILLALALASFAMRKLAQLFVRAIAHVIFAFASPAFAPRRPIYARRAVALVRITSDAHTCRRFARPPPSR